MADLKKYISIIISIFILISVTACAGTGSSSTESVGTAEYEHPDSPYFEHPDFYNMESTDTLTILSEFTTYQQTTEYTCGPAAALMVLGWYGIEDHDEMELADILGAEENVGTEPENISSFFEGLGWNVDVNLGGTVFEDLKAFTDFAAAALSEGHPIIVDWMEWGGHYVDIIGYDTMGTSTRGDDVLILADPADTADHLQDGYYIYSAEMFFYMWREGAGRDGNEAREQIYIVAYPES